MDAERLALPDASFDVVLCALGLMYVPDPAHAILEMRRVLRKSGRLILAVWGERAQCGWADLFPIVDAEVTSDVCPLFFRLGHGNTLADLCSNAGFDVTVRCRITTTLDYADGDQACDAAFIAGPVALAWSHVYLGRMHDLDGDREEALADYRAALSVADAPEAARSAAQHGIEQGYQLAVPSQSPG